MAQFLSYFDPFSNICYVALDDISCVISQEEDDAPYKSVICLKSDPPIQLYALRSPIEVMNGTVVNIGKLL